MRFDQRISSLYSSVRVVRLGLAPSLTERLSALKCDLRDEASTRERLARYGMQAVQYEEGLATARRIRASRYLGMQFPFLRLILPLIVYLLVVECSSKHNRGVKEVFYEVARVSLTTRARGQSGGGGPRSCVVM
jgi:Rho family protein